MSLVQSDLEWVRVTAASPCPTCAETKWCSVSADGDWSFCMNEKSDRPAAKGARGWMHRLTEKEEAPKVTLVRPKVIKTTRYEARNESGDLVAVHVRKDYADGDKAVIWYGPDGLLGIKRLGIELADIPLYGLSDLLAADAGAAVFLCEGEKATDALKSIGLLAVGTMCGADVTPSQRVLAPLIGHEVLQWPDNDEAGHKHMRAIAAALIPRDTICRRIVWSDAPKKADAADFRAAGLGRDELQAMYGEAVERGENDALLGTHAHEQLDEQLQIGAAEAQSQNQVAHDVNNLNQMSNYPGLVIMSQVRPRVVQWLWRGRIALGENTVLDGDPGLGKTMWMMDLSARLTRGHEMPDGTLSDLGGRPRGVVILNCEDAKDTALAPRLLAAGADMDRVGLIESVPGKDGETEFPEILRDLPWIERAIKVVDAALVIVDPLVGFLGDSKEINANADQDMRRVLNPFGQLMRKMGAAGVVVRHLRKQAASSTLYRGSGSIAISATARGGLLVARDPEDRTKKRRILSVQKTNLAEEAGSLAYHITANHEGYPYVVWEGKSHHTAETLLAEPAGIEEQTQAEEAVDFLEEELRAGPAMSHAVMAEAKRNGISLHTLRRARLQLEIKRENGNVYKHGDKWAWKLPEGHKARFYDENHAKREVAQ